MNMRSTRRGFTMLEVLVASAMVGMLLIALNTFIFSMVDLWGGKQDERNFDLHVGTVTRYLQHEMNVAGLPPNAVAVTSTATTSTPSIFMQSLVNPSTAVNTSDPLLTFILPYEDRQLPWPKGTLDTTSHGGGPEALPDLTCNLAVTAKGLVLLWHSQYESTFATDPPRATILSPLVTEMKYEYYTATTGSVTWTSATAIQYDDTSGLPLIPNQLRLTFTYEPPNNGPVMTRSTVIVLPTPAQGLPAY